MAPRVSVGIVALAGVSICGLLSTITSLEMADKVSESLPKENEFAQPGWYWPKILRLHRQYNRLYPFNEKAGPANGTGFDFHN